jgi:hypothetical protein
MNAFIVMLEIMDRLLPADAAYHRSHAFLGEHDEIYACLPMELTPEDSADHEALVRAGWHVQEDAWMIFT